jgi:hypothetical protein
VFPFGVLPELANLLRAQWEQALSLELETGQSIPWVFHWNDRGTLKEIHPKALYHRVEGGLSAGRGADAHSPRLQENGGEES